MNPKSSARQEFLAGLRAELPILLGVIPFGLIYGAIAIQLGVPATITQAMSVIIFGGSAQVIALPLLAVGAPGIVLILTVFVVNLRHLLYSASLAPYLEKQSLAWKAILAYLLTDEAYAVTIVHFQKTAEAGENPTTAKRHRFMLGAGGTLWICWQISTALGLFVGGQIPPEWGLDFALPLTFIALVVPMIKSRAYVVAAVVAGISGVVAYGLPYKLGYMLAAVLGVTIGMILEARWSRA